MYNYFSIHLGLQGTLTLWLFSLSYLYMTNLKDYSLKYSVPSGRYEGPFNTFVDEINSIATYQWWEGAMYSILSVLAYPLAWSWQHWRRRLKLQRLREFVRSEYDHACLRSCRSRALYEGIKVCDYQCFSFLLNSFFLYLLKTEYHLWVFV